MDTQDTKISSNRQKKMVIVEDLTQNFGKAKAVVFTNYQGLTHKQIESLKRAIKPFEAEFVVAKNSLLERSAEANSLKLDGDHSLTGQTGTLFLYKDIVYPLKALAKTIKELNLPNVRFGVMDGSFITAEQVLKLSTLPNRETLLAQLAFGLKSPISGLHRALNWNLQKFVMTLNAIAQNKPAVTVEAPVAPAPQPQPSQPATEVPVEPVVEAKEEPVAEPTAQPAETPTDQPASPSEALQAGETKSEGGEN